MVVFAGTLDLSKMASLLSTVSAFSFAPKFSVNPNNPSTISHSVSPRFPKSTRSLQNPTKFRTHYVSPMAASASASSSSSVGNSVYMEEPATSVKFPKSLNIPDCSSSMSLLGTGYREKVFAIIGVKVYAAGLYVNPSMLKDLRVSEGKSENLAVFQSLYQSSLEKSLEIVLVRDVDGKTFWDALDEAVSPRMTSPTPVDHSALETFRSIFQGRSLKKGTQIFLTWLQPSKMSVSVSSNGVPEKSDARIESMNVTKALFDVFFGESPVSPTLKVSVASGLASSL